MAWAQGHGRGPQQERTQQLPEPSLPSHPGAEQLRVTADNPRPQKASPRAPSLTVGTRLWEMLCVTSGPQHSLLSCPVTESPST